MRIYKIILFRMRKNTFYKIYITKIIPLQKFKMRIRTIEFDEFI